MSVALAVAVTPVWLSMIGVAERRLSRLGAWLSTRTDLLRIAGLVDARRIQRVFPLGHGRTPSEERAQLLYLASADGTVVIRLTRLG